MATKQSRKSAKKEKAASIPGLEAATRQLEKLMADSDLITQDDLDALLKSLQPAASRRPHPFATCFHQVNGHRISSSRSLVP